MGFERRDASTVSRSLRIDSSAWRLVGVQLRTGRKATNDEIQKELDQLLMRVTTPKRGWFGLSEEQKYGFQLRVEDIVPEDLRTIDRLLQQNGFPITDENRLRVYMEKLADDAKRGR